LLVGLPSVEADPDAQDLTGAQTKPGLVAVGQDRLDSRDELTARAEAYARRARTSSTWAAYQRQWARFEAWCAAWGSVHCRRSR
jgi:hypothetical protein